MKDNQRYQILLIDDDHEIQDALQSALSNEFEILTGNDGEEGVRQADSHAPDLVILDINMPGKNGIWACEQLRSSQRTRHIPIIVLSSGRDIDQKLAAYSVGADDYLEKPFTFAELRAKIDAKIRRIEEKIPREIARGNLTLFMARMEVEVDGRRVSLSVLENRLLAYFLTNPDEVLPRQQILMNVWKNVNVSDRTVDAHIVSLRRKITGFDHEIVTVYGAGYSLRPKAEKFQSSRSSN